MIEVLIMMEESIFCFSLKTIESENNTFNACFTQSVTDVGFLVNYISSCIRIIKYEHQKRTTWTLFWNWNLHCIRFQMQDVSKKELERRREHISFEYCFSSCSIDYHCRRDLFPEKTFVPFNDYFCFVRFSSVCTKKKFNSWSWRIICR